MKKDDSELDLSSNPIHIKKWGYLQQFATLRLKFQLETARHDFSSQIF